MLIIDAVLCGFRVSFVRQLVLGPPMAGTVDIDIISGSVKGHVW